MKIITDDKPSSHIKLAKKRKKNALHGSGTPTQGQVPASGSQSGIDDSSKNTKNSGVPPPATKSVIDDIFAQKPKVVPSVSSSTGPAKNNVKKKKKIRPAIKGSAADPLGQDEWCDDGLGGIYNKNGWTGRTTEEGLKIYKTHLLQLQEGGGTENCPFDCNCCF
eukprot:GEMP01103674.1.p1 GENE.GEMP01103674.1~~GEMP01103674.1.p1  ORF type:complete len:164 (+),score=23.86 GEMP01103674.1:227-718(+)